MRTALLLLGVLGGVVGIILFGIAVVGFRDLGENEKRMGILDSLTGGWICAFRGAKRHWGERPDLRRLLYFGVTLPLVAVAVIWTVSRALPP